ncbi:MAG TPA: glycosyltransferase family 1 protein [bacterium]
MRIGLSLAALANAGGIGRYVRILAKNLPVIFPEHDYFGYIPKFRANEVRDILEQENIEGWKPVGVDGANRWAYENAGLATAIKDNPVDVFHGPDYLVPMEIVPMCVTVHDLAFKLHPKGMAWKSRLLFSTGARASVRRATRSGVVFADSQSTLNDLRKLKWLPKDKGRVVYLCCEDEFRIKPEHEKIEEVLSKHRITGNYILYAGPVEFRKNIKTLIDAYLVVVKVLQKKSIPLPTLVATGPLGAGGEKILADAEKSGGLFFRHLGYVAREELIALYHGCDFFCYPSRYEGFGLPPLEAMTAGKPVIVSNASSLPEVVGDAGILVDPDDTQGWSEAIVRLVSGDGLRQEMSVKSLEQAGRFSTEKMCGEVMDGYISAVKV